MRSSVMPRSAFTTRKPPRAGRPAWKCAEAYKRWLRKLPCACEGRNPWCAGDTEAAHVDIAGGKGVATKVADRFCIPLSSGCHKHQTEVIGWPEFEKTLRGGSAVALAGTYWQNWDGRIAWEHELADRAEAVR